RQTVSTLTEVVDSPHAEFPADRRAEIGILVIAEEVYAEGEGDRANLMLSAQDIDLVNGLKKRCSKVVTLLFSGRPLIITNQLKDWDAFVAAWLPGTEGQGIADVIFGDYPFVGKLPHHWPRNMQQVPIHAIDQSGELPLWPFGFGL